MIRVTLQIEFKDLNLSISQIENDMGYKEGEVRELVTDLIGEVLKETEHICKIKGEYIIYDDVHFNTSEKSVMINNIVFQVRDVVFGQIKRSESIAIFLCTAGKEIGALSRKAMMGGDLLRGYVYDVVGSEIVEAAADQIQDGLGRAMTADGMKITNRYSPGYCGWDVAEQHKLFQLVTNNSCGITLTPSALMDPVKSVSGIIGIGEKVRMNPYTCSLCDMNDCIYRKTKEKH